MIQRIQTIYYLVVIISLSIISFGASIFQFKTKENIFTFSVYGVKKFDLTGKIVEIKSAHYYFITLALIIMLGLVILLYKKQKKQLSIGRLIFVIYFIFFIVLFFASYLGNEFTNSLEFSKSYKIGFYLYIFAFPFVYLGNNAVKRDVKLLDSLNRLR